MKEKYIKARIAQCRIVASLSTCKRRKVGSLLLDPITNVVLCEGYNGTVRGATDCCGGKNGEEHICERERLKIPSGANVEVGCVHSEQNLICNAALNGIKTGGSWMFVTLEPCLLCAKLIKQAGIKKVFIIDSYSGQQGVRFLEENGVEVEYVEE